jgi:hypothetical protein
MEKGENERVLKHVRKAKISAGNVRERGLLGHLYVDEIEYKNWHWTSKIKKSELD